MSIAMKSSKGGACRWDFSKAKHVRLDLRSWKRSNCRGGTARYPILVILRPAGNPRGRLSKIVLLASSRGSSILGKRLVRTRPHFSPTNNSLDKELSLSELSMLLGVVEMQCIST